MPRPGRKESVLEAAVSLFSRKGYHGTTVRDIAEESGMLSGSLYAHVSSKEELLVEIVNRAAGQFMAAVQPIADGPGSAAEKLKAAMAAHVRVVTGSMEAATVFLHEWKALSLEGRAEVSRWRKAYEALWDRMITEGIAGGEFAVSDPRVARLLVLSSVNWLYAWYKPDGPLGPDQIADQFADLLLDGLMRKGVER